MTERRKQQLERLEKVNQLIETMGNCGRRFFYNQRYDRYATMQIDDRGKVWFIDDHNGARIYTHYRGSWRRFSHGGTMRSLVQGFRDFITKGEPLSSSHFGPWPDWYAGGDLWGYGESMARVREAAVDLGIIKQIEDTHE